MHEIKGFKEKNIPTACLKIMIEQLAEFQQGADVDVPGLYDAHQCRLNQIFLSLEISYENGRKLRTSKVYKHYN